MSCWSYGVSAEYTAFICVVKPYKYICLSVFFLKSELLLTLVLQKKQQMSVVLRVPHEWACIDYNTSHNLFCCCILSAIGTQTHIHIHTHTHTCMHTNTHMHIHTYVHTHMCVRGHTHIHTRTHTHIHTHTHAHVWARTHIYTHIHTHTHTHTHTRLIMINNLGFMLAIYCISLEAILFLTMMYPDTLSENVKCICHVCMPV